MTAGTMDRAMIGLDTTDASDILGLPRGVAYLFIELLAWCAERDSEGAFERARLTRVTSEPDPEAGMALLVGIGRLEATADGWQVVDWARYGLSTDYKVRRRKGSALGHAITRDHNLGAQGKHDQCRPPCQYIRGNVNVDVSVDSALSPRPLPLPNLTSPDLKGRGKGRGRAFTAAPSGVASVAAPKRDNHIHDADRPLDCESCLEGMTAPISRRANGTYGPWVLVIDEKAA